MRKISFSNTRPNRVSPQRVELRLKYKERAKRRRITRTRKAKTQMRVKRRNKG